MLERGAGRTDVVELLEASGARVTSWLATAMAATSPTSGSEALPFRDGGLVALGPGRYVNRAIGVGTGRFEAEELAALESFFARHGVAASVEVSSWATPGLLGQLGDRGYRPQWFRNVYVRQVEPVEQASHGVTVQAVDDSLFDRWQATFAAAFDVTDEDSRRISDEHAAAAYATTGSTHFLAFVDDQPAGCGTVQLDGMVAWIGGAATVPSLRRRGVQSALIDRRLAVAADAGCDLAVSTALPAGASARNLAAHGFQLAYTQLVVTRVASAG